VRGRIKGTVIIACVKALRGQRDAAMPYLSERARRFLGDERVLPSSWYEEALAFELYRTYARVAAGGNTMRVWHEMGRQAARIHAAEAYRHVVKARDTASILCTGGPALLHSQHDTGKLTATILEPGQARVEVRDFGPMCSEWSHMLAGYLRGLAEATSAQHIEVRILEVDLAKRDAVFAVAWQEPAKD
jgi:hypothetical protein